MARLSFQVEDICVNASNTGEDPSIWMWNQEAGGYLGVTLSQLEKIVAQVKPMAWREQDYPELREESGGK